MRPELGKIWWLASYPKSGNTWIRMFFTAYLTGKPVDINSKYQFIISDIDPKIHPKFTDVYDYLQYYSASISAQRNVCLKTHHANVAVKGKRLIPIKRTNGGIYLTRDPRDLVISISKHYEISIDEAIKFINDDDKMIINKNSFLGHVLSSWSKHVSSWLIIPGVMCFRYEDILKYPKEAFKKMVEILYMPVYEEQRFDFAVENASFKNLSEQEDKNDFVERKGKDKFFRVGKANQWRKILTDKQVNIIEENNKEIMERFGYL